MAYSYVQYTGNGSTTNYVFSFPYLESSHIKVRVNGVITSFTFLNSSTVTISPAPASGAVIDIRRETPKDNPPVDFTDGSVLLEADLDLLAKFNLYTAQESADGVADSITKDTLGVWDAQSRRIKGVADPINANDAVNKTWAETSMSSQLAQATTQASNAAASATAAAASASTATTQASTATTKASEASASATAAASSATSASGSASTATTKASEASSSASAAATSASNAATSATNAAASATSAASNATNAATSASNALSSANSAAASFDAFDDRYLGPKSSAPTVDNDGNTLQIGAMYYSTTALDMFVWNGSAWVTVSNTTSATNAANSASAAATSATNAANSASAASTSATNAANSATAASGSASTANSASTTATNAANSATASASSASTSASNAATSATQASTSASAAATSASQASAVALGNEPVRHSVRPSLLLDFANTKTLDPRITFTRGSTGTFYDGKTVAKAEENLLTYSEAFANGVWITNSATKTSTTATDPAGGSSALTLTRTAANGYSLRQFTSAPCANRTYTLSCWLKGTAGETVQLYMDNVTNQSINTTVTLTSTWTRYTVTGTLNSTATNVSLGVAFQGGTTASVVDVAFFQLEERSSVTAYTPTTASPITNYIPALQTAGNNVPRFEHNPVTGESLGLEIEEQRTNLFTYSDDFSNGNWTKNALTVTTNTVVAPDGTLTGEKLVENTAAIQHFINQSFTASNIAYTFSVYAKAAERNWLVLYPGGSGTAVWFNLSTGTVGTVEASVTSSSITHVGNGWYRCSLTATLPAASATRGIYLANADGSASYTGNGFAGVYIWGAQFEAGSFATSYIPTVASQVTRSADSASMTGTNFSSWYRADEGTLYTESQLPTLQTAGNPRVASLSDNTNNNELSTLYALGTPALGFNAKVNNSFVAILSTTVASSAITSASKNAAAYRVNNFAMSVNGATVATDTAGAIPIVNRLNIGAGPVDISGSQGINGNIRKIAFYPRRLTNAELQGLTTV